MSTPKSITEAQARLEQERENRGPIAEPAPKSAEDFLARLLPNVVAEDLPTEAELEQSERAREQARRQERHAAWARKVANCPVPLSTAARDALCARSWQESAPLNTVRAWLEAAGQPNARRVLVLLGRPGTGKTFAAAYAYLAQRRNDAAYAKVRNVCQRFRASFGEEAADYERMLRAHLLIVDELGTERGSDVEVAQAALHDIVDERQGRRTILISNLSKRQFLERYDERTIDRLRECGAMREFSGQSMRRGKL